VNVPVRMAAGYGTLAMINASSDWRLTMIMMHSRYWRSHVTELSGKRLKCTQGYNIYPNITDWRIVLPLPERVGGMRQSICTKPRDNYGPTRRQSVRTIIDSDEYSEDSDEDILPSQQHLIVANRRGQDGLAPVVKPFEGH
jgi:hypothetical protein